MQKLLRGGGAFPAADGGRPGGLCASRRMARRPRIAEWYAGVDGSVTVEAVRAKYGPRVRGESRSYPA